MEIWIHAGRGLRYREHPTRKYGPRPDRLWSLKYKLDGRAVTESLGWRSAGVSKDRCLEILSVLRRNWRTGQGPRTWKELQNEKQNIIAQKSSETTNKITMAEFWIQEYRPRLLMTARPSAVPRVESFFRSRAAGLLDRPLASLTTAVLEDELVRPMLADGLSPAYIESCLGVISALWNTAKKLGLVRGRNPKTKVRRPKTDNRRERFLTPAEASRLLAVLRKRHTAAHDLALLSLFAGLRAGEGLALTWADIDLEGGLIFIKDTKNRYNRHAYITAELRAMLSRRYQDQPKTDKVIVGPQGGRAYCEIAAHFREALKELGLNQGITDRRRKAVFHTLRHTFASWLIQRGKPLWTVSKLLGHRSVRWTERYAHLDPELQKEAVLGLEGFLF